MDYSFYGGRPGQSMVVVKYFSSIAEMNEKFNKGDAYTEVGYGECVLINTTDPRNLENGKLYKRGLQGAEYLGTIKGPAGYSPHMQLDDYETIQNEIKQYKDKEGNPLPEMDFLDDEGVFDFTYAASTNDIVPGYTPSVLNNDGTVKTAAEYQDTIKWIYASVREFNKEMSAEETVVKIGFKIPYHVFEQEAYSISAYTAGKRISDNIRWDFIKDNKGEIKNNPLEYSNLVTRVDDKKHPFYSKWRLQIPQGVKGDSVKGLKVMTVSEYKQQRTEDANNNKNIINHFEWEENVSFTEEDNDRQILVYEYYDFRNKFEGDRITKYIGEYNTISSVEVDEYGTLKVNYTYDEPQFFNYLIQWVTDVNLNPDNGHFVLTYNIPAGATLEEQKENQKSEIRAQYEVDLTWVKDVQLEDGILTFIFTSQDEEGNAQKYSQLLDWIQNISIAQNGKVTLTHSYKEGEEFKQTVLEEPLQWVTDLDITPKGDLAVYYNVDVDYHESAFNAFEIEFVSTEAIDIYEPYGDDIYRYLYQISGPLFTLSPNMVWKGLLSNNIQQHPTVLIFKEESNSSTAYLKAPVPLNPAVNGYFSTLGYISNNNVLLHKDRFKWVEDIQISPSGDVTTIYNATDDSGQKKSLTNKDALTWIKSVAINENYQLIATNNHGTTSSLGSVKVDETLSVAFNISPNESFKPTGEEEIQAGNLISQNLLFLNKKYPTGLTTNASGNEVSENWMKGKIVTIGPVDENNLGQRKNFYAFDYNKSEWYYLGNLGGLGVLEHQQVAEKDVNNVAINNALKQLDIGGICLVTSQRPNAATATLDFILEEELDVE